MRVSLCLLTVWLFLACADRARGNCTNSFLVKTDGKGEIYPNPQSIMKVCRNARCTFFLVYHRYKSVYFLQAAIIRRFL